MIVEQWEMAKRDLVMFKDPMHTEIECAPWAIGVHRTMGMVVCVDRPHGVPSVVRRVLIDSGDLSAKTRHEARLIRKATHAMKFSAISLGDLLNAVIEASGLSFTEMVNKGRSRPQLAARQAFVLAARSVVDRRYSWPEIARSLGKRGHSGVREMSTRPVLEEARAILCKLREAGLIVES